MSSASALIEGLEQLSSNAAKLSCALSSLNHNFWGGWVLGVNDGAWKGSAGVGSDDSPHEQAAKVYSCLYHLHDGDGRDTWQMAGLLVVPDEILELGKCLNASKDNFERMLFQYKYPGKVWENRNEDKLPRKNVSLMKILHEMETSARASESHLAREVLSRLGSSRLHIRHCTRKIRILDEMPEAISLSWVKQRKSIQKISAADCLKKLNELRSGDDIDPGIEAQIAIVNNLSAEDEKRLRQVQTVSTPSIKGKIYFSNDRTEELGYLSMPALVPAGKLKGKLPDFTRLSDTPSTTQRRRRKDSKLSTDPLLSSIRVFLSK